MSFWSVTGVHMQLQDSSSFIPFLTVADVRVQLQDGSTFMSFRTVAFACSMKLSDLCTERS